ncbi:MAG TPA: hypothetical protein VJW76_12685 [Verrucomicrobiae bacterium]|nr:hypothetical protein [Verrucomicrobiae bacterium]
MKATTKKLLSGRLMLLAAFLFFIAAAMRSERGGVFVAVGLMFLCTGMVLLRQARRQP